MNGFSSISLYSDPLKTKPTIRDLERSISGSIANRTNYQHTCMCKRLTLSVLETSLPMQRSHNTLVTDICSNNWCAMGCKTQGITLTPIFTDHPTNLATGADTFFVKQLLLLRPE